MKKLIFIILIILGITSCKENITYDLKTFSNYDLYVEYSINHLKSPVVLICIEKYKTNLYTKYAILVKDANGVIKYYNNESELANIIGSSYRLGEIIR